VSDAHLTIVVARDAKRLGQSSNIVPGKVVEEICRDAHFTRRLGVRLWNARLNGLGEEFGNVGLLEGVSGLRTSSEK